MTTAIWLTVAVCSVLIIESTIGAGGGLMVQAGDEFYDNRCICICPSFTVIGESETNRKIYIDVLEKEKCSCKNVLEKYKPNQTEVLEKFCPRCTCNFEVRNTTTMKIVVIIIICILALLFIYMGFLLCLDPLVNRKARLYQAQLNEDIVLDNNSEPAGGAGGGIGGVIDSSSGNVTPGTSGSVMNRVTHEQSKWKKQVQEQRRTVYDKHSLLN